MIPDKTFRALSISSMWLWLMIFALIPSFLLLMTSLLTHGDNELLQLRLTLNNYFSVFNLSYFKVFLRSIMLASSCTVLCLLLAYPFSYILARSEAKYKRILLLLVIIPFWTSSLIRSYAIVAILKTNGIINHFLLWTGIISQPLQLLYTHTATLLGLVYTLLPLMIFPIYSSIEKLDTRFIDAARDLGANKTQVFFKVILPLTFPGILAGSILVFLPAMTLFYIPDLLGGAKTILIGNIIQNQFLAARNWPMGATISIVLTLIMSIVLIFYWRTSPKRQDSFYELH